ncbi:MAG: hypothetical protein KKB20_10215 [Proteobacteria bacterium]|nr:hypothetical protein [Pseudomonadota bacterium]
MNEFDRVIKNGRVVDPASGWDGPLHIGVCQGVIDTLTRSDIRGRMEIEAARRFGLERKGRVAFGADADLAIFDFQALEDRSTYQEPGQGASGMAFVIVAGRPVVDGGRLTGATPGRAVRPG